MDAWQQFLSRVPGGEAAARALDSALGHRFQWWLARWTELTYCALLDVCAGHSLMAKPSCTVIVSESMLLSAYGSTRLLFAGGVAALSRQLLAALCALLSRAGCCLRTSAD